MGSFAKKIKMNQVILVDKKKIESGELPKHTKPLSVKKVRAGAQIEKQASNIPKKDLKRIVSVARAHALWLHMTILKKVFRFTSSQLLEYHEKLQDVYKYAIDDTSGGTTEDIVRVTVHGSSKKDNGNMDYPEYEAKPFDEKGELYSYYVDKYNDMKKSLTEYKKLERTFEEFDKCEVASMLVLKDYFGFARIRLMRFVEKARTYFKGASWRLYEEQIKYLEKLCHKKFTEFKAVKGGKGVLWYGEGEACGTKA